MSLMLKPFINAWKKRRSDYSSLTDWSDINSLSNFDALYQRYKLDGGVDGSAYFSVIGFGEHLQILAGGDPDGHYHFAAKGQLIDKGVGKRVGRGCNYNAVIGGGSRVTVPAIALDDVDVRETEFIDALTGVLH